MSKSNRNNESLSQTDQLSIASSHSLLHGGVLSSLPASMYEYQANTAHDDADHQQATDAAYRHPDPQLVVGCTRTRSR